jgi:hypothetical protein
VVLCVVPPAPAVLSVEAVAPVAVPDREKDTFEPDGVRVLSALGPREAPLLRLVLREKDGLEIGVEVAEGPDLPVDEPNPVPDVPRFKLVERRTGMRVP